MTETELEDDEAAAANGEKALLLLDGDVAIELITLFGPDPLVLPVEKK